MPNVEATGPNAEMIAYWNEQAGPRWVESQALLDDQIAPLGLAAMERARVAAGERALDVGCGCGQSTLQLAARVGPRGEVVAVDVSTPMLERARARAAAERLANVRFLHADAQLAPVAEAAFDLVYSRFGVMFFSDPPAAFANLRKSLAPRGRVAFVCWQALKRNEWVRVPLMAAAQHTQLPAPAAPGAPGPFAFADPAHVRAILEAAGFEDVAIEPLEGELAVGGVGGGVERAVAHLMEMGPMAAALREAPEAARPKLMDAVREALAPYATPVGVKLGYAAWIVHAV